MASPHEHFALDWIKADLLETLNDARAALDEYAEGPGDEVRLRSCLTNVHQVHGTLVMLELEGVTLLADHMEQLAQAMLAGQINDTAIAGQYLMQGILELPGYLDELQRGAQDSTSPTLPLVNEIRVLLDLAPLADEAGTSLVGGVSDAAVEKFVAIDGQQKVARIRTAYQTVLLSILKGEDRQAALDTLTKIAVSLQRVCVDTPLERQWQAFGEFIASLAHKQGGLESEAVKLLRRVDVEIKSLGRDGAAALREPVNMELIQQLLDAAEARAHNNPTMEGLRRAVDRDINHNTLAISGRQALASAAQALQEELGSVKDRLDILVRSPSVDLAELRGLVGPLNQIGSTLSLLGFESSREIVADQVEAIESLVVLGDGDPQGVQSIAGALIQIDENLSSVAQGSEKSEVEQITDDAQLQVLRESRTGLEEVKQSIVDFVTARFDQRHLENVAATLNGICGALEIIPLPKVIDLLKQIQVYVVDHLGAGHKPDWQALDLLADGVSAVDYYLERLSQENISGVDDILAVATRSLAELLEDTAAKPQVAQTPADTPATGAVAAEAGQQIHAADSEAVPQADEPEAFADIPVFTDAAGVGDQAVVKAADDTRMDDVSAAAQVADDEPAVSEIEDVEDSVAESAEEDAGDVVAFDLAELEIEDDEGVQTAELQVAESTDEAAPVLPEVTQPAGAEGLDLGDFDLGGQAFDELVDNVEEEDFETAMAEADEEDEDEAAAADQGDAVAAGHPDPEIVEIFLEEVAEVLEGVDEVLPQWGVALEMEEPLIELRRAFHTLKGSGRIVQAAEIGELAWGIENMLNRVIDGTVTPTAQFVDIVTEARDLIPGMADAFEVGKSSDLDAIANVIDRADVLASGGELVQAKEDENTGVTQPQAESTVEEAGSGLDEFNRTDVGLNHDSEITPAAEDADQETAWLAEDLDEEDGGNGFELFVAEAREHLQVIDDENAKVPWRLSDPMARAFHTLAGSSAIAGITKVRFLVEPAYQVVEAFRGKEIVPGLQDFIQAAADHLRACFASLDNHEEWEEPFEFVAQADDLLARQPSKASNSQQILASQATMDVLDGEDQLRAYLSGRAETCADMLNALADLSSLANGLREVNLAELATAFMQILTNATIAGQVPDRCVPVVQNGYDRLVDQLNDMAAGGEAKDESNTIEQLLALDFAEDELPIDDLAAADEQEVHPGTFADDGTDDSAESEVSATLADEEDILAEADHTLEDVSEAITGGDDYIDLESLEMLADEEPQEQRESVPETAAAPLFAKAEDSPEPVTQTSPETGAETVYDDVDPELIDVFFEEADEICEELENGIMRWSQEMDNRIYMETLLRGLHTFKGGARLCGLAALGDLAHEFESLVIEVQNEERLIDADLFSRLHQQFDNLTEQLMTVRAGVFGTSAEPEPVNTGESEVAEEAVGVDVPLPAQEDLAAAPAERAEPIKLEPTEQDVVAKADAALNHERASQEMVRVGSSLLEELVNLAGENSILRARVEQGMADFTGSLDEMETTIERLREQLRRLEIETETQILFRHERTDGPQYENFDPLEMDRYSQLQQLSKSLSESASDMLDLKDTLLFKARESETLLLQQARINTELQEGLMRTRMVPFSRLLPRLRRIVRQVSSELAKEVEFHVQNAEGELDRNLLERMVPPLEHMLRNAVDHGIESGDLRRNFGKPTKGRIDLRLSREGGDVVIEISDDGAGVDVESVRAKAVERGLMSQDANLSDDEVTQFILAPGFSTAKSVTQISGRGVGMDVVHSEVKQLGGSISILSRPGKGTRFVLRVPFTVSVNRALMVSVAEDLYAIPLNTIEGIVLLNPEQLQELYGSEEKTFEYAGTPYRVRYLGQYLGREYHGLAPGQTSVPMVLVRSGDHAVAIHVDLVQGSREIVVKSLGPQFAGVGGISGATILGDGSVVVILDLLALIRAQQHQRRAKPAAAARLSKPGPRCVLVVDDSVTVRKVTSRLLERQGMDVLVAKDGIEAVALLQERKPDVMLLDIEMPRMDGFEVARQVRHDERLGNLPIVMISSRTGDKHKEHANQLGVNKFLGKPFQENELLATIDELVTRV